MAVQAKCVLFFFFSCFQLWRIPTRSCRVPLSLMPPSHPSPLTLEVSALTEEAGVSTQLELL